MLVFVLCSVVVVVDLVLLELGDEYLVCFSDNFWVISGCLCGVGNVDCV